MGTIASLLGMLGDTQPRPWDVAQRSIAEGETGLAHLADLKRKQAAEAAMMERIKTDPALAQQLFGGGPVLGSLTQPQGAPGAGPMTQQTVQPGQPPGAPQTVPGGQDLSQFATQATPPQSIIGSLGPAGQPQMQPPRNPLLEMARTDPRAAMMLQQQMQGQQDAAMKRQEQQLKMGTQIMDYLGRGAQGVTDQASLDAFREETARVHPQAAASLPQTYSKEAMQPFIAKALDVKEAMTLQVQTLAAQAELAKARMSGRVASTDEYLKALGIAPGQETAQDMQRALELKNKHLAEIEAGKVNPQIIPGPGGEYWAVNPRTLEQRPVGGGGGAGGGAGATGPGGASTGEQLRAPMTEGQSKTAVYTSTMQTGNDQLTALEKSGDYTSWKAPLAQMPGGRLLLSDKQKEYETAKGVFLTGLLRYQSAGQITKQEWDDYGKLYFPQPDDPPAMVEFKQKNREAAIKTMGGALGRPLPGQQAGGQSGTQAQPTSQGTTGTGGQPPTTSQGPATFDRADFMQWRQGAGKTGNPTQADIEAYFQAKGLKRR